MYCFLLRISFVAILFSLSLMSCERKDKSKKESEVEVETKIANKEDTTDKRIAEGSSSENNKLKSETTGCHPHSNYIAPTKRACLPESRKISITHKYFEQRPRKIKFIYPVLKAIPTCSVIDSLNGVFLKTSKEIFLDYLKACNLPLKYNQGIEPEGLFKKDGNRWSAGLWGSFNELNDQRAFIYKDSILSVYHYEYSYLECGEEDEHRRGPATADTWTENYNLVTGARVQFFDIFEKELIPVIRHYAILKTKPLVEAYNANVQPEFAFNDYSYAFYLVRDLKCPNFFLSEKGLGVLFFEYDISLRLLPKEDVRDYPKLVVFIPFSHLEPYYKRRKK